MSAPVASRALRRSLHSSCSAGAAPKNSRFPVQQASRSAKAAGAADAGSSAGADVAARSGNVLGLPYLSQEHTASTKLVGKAFAFDQEYTKSILTPALPKRLRHDMSFASTPSTVLRKATTQLVQQLEPEAKAVRVLRGEPGSGRSTILLQTIAHYRSSGWLVLHIQDAYVLTNGSTAFVPAEARNGKPFWQQPIAAQQLCSTFIAANGKTVDKLDASLRDALKKGSKESSFSLHALEKLLSESNVPVLLAVDGIEALFGQTNYVDANAASIPASQLALPAVLASYLSGTAKLASGGAIGAFDKATARIPLPQEASVQVEALDRQEAAGIYEHLFKTDMLSGPLSDATFLEAYVSSDGHARLFTRGIRSVPGGTSRGVIKNGKKRGVTQRADRVLAVEL